VNEGLREALLKEFPSGENEYHAWFLRSVGILGDPVSARRAIAAARETGTRLVGNGYGYDRAFTHSLAADELERIDRLHHLTVLEAGRPRVVDPFSGGGAIPFEALRLGCSSVANELNPVAAAVLHGTVELPARLGVKFADSIEHFGARWAALVNTRLEPFFPKAPGEAVIAYVWAHAVRCPSTGWLTPLCPDFWLAHGKAGRDVAIRLQTDARSGEITPEVVEGKEAAKYGSRSTYGQGTATSVWTDETFSGDYIRAEAQAGRMGQLLLGVVYSQVGSPGRRFRAPNDEDLAAVEAASEVVQQHWSKWLVADLVPDEPIGSASNYDRGHRLYGIDRWWQFFSPRQLLSHVTALESLLETVSAARSELSAEESDAVGLYLALALDKAVDYSSRQSSWHSSRLTIRNTFDKHNFAFKWTFAEFDGASAAVPWAVSQVVDAYRGIARLAASDATLFEDRTTSDVTISLHSAVELDLPSESVSAVVTDPPYYDNVMYGECSDYFYVWLKRSLRATWPELVQLALSDKEQEAVANKALFKDMATHSGRGRRGAGAVTAAQLADRHYEDLLTRSFDEAHRVLRSDGVMTVMFTHKRVDAWDTLGAALLEAGFEVSSSWPVHTEPENSLHIAKKNSASSTILLGCRKRASTEPAYWSDIKREVEDAAEEAAKRFSAEGIKGVDLTLATYGPALSVLSRNWPVYTGNLTEEGEREKLRPDAALDLARHRVALLKKRELLGGRDVEFDRATDWWLLAWNDFQAAQFPAGEALKLCIAMDLDLDDVAKQHKLVKAASGDVTLLTPAQRRTAKSLDADAGTWPTLIDALHALMLTHDEEGLTASRAWLTRTGKGDDERFGALIEAAIHAVPRTRDKDGEFTRPEARILESLRATLFDWIESPAEPELGEALTFDFAEG
jgi:adenine-specific DNA methylase